MGTAMNLTIIIIVAAIGVPALVYSLISYFNQAGQNQRIDMEALSISQETAARIAADNSLTTQINQETAARIAKDMTLMVNVSTLSSNITTTNSNLNVTNSYLNTTNNNLVALNNSVTQSGILNSVVNSVNTLSGNLTVNGIVPIVVNTTGGGGLTIYLQNTTIVPGSYSDGSGGLAFSVDYSGRLTFANSSNGLNQTLTYLLQSVASLSGNLSMVNGTLTVLVANVSAPSGVVPGTYTNPSFSVNAQGYITNATSGTITLAGDVINNALNNTVAKLQGRPIDVTSSPTFNNVTIDPQTILSVLTPAPLTYVLDSNIFTSTGYVVLTTNSPATPTIGNFTIPSKYFILPYIGQFSVSVELTGSGYNNGQSMFNKVVYYFQTSGVNLVSAYSPTTIYALFNFPFFPVFFSVATVGNNLIQFQFSSPISTLIVPAYISYSATIIIAPVQV
jgi:hypothetical protein